MSNYLRALRAAPKEGTDPNSGPIRFTASTEGIKRDGLNLDASAWFLDNYRANPVVLWAHDYMGRTLPIGKADVEIDGKTMFADITFDPDDDFARQVEKKYRSGFLNAVSVGWNVTPDEPPRLDLLDISAVPVPADPQALAERMKRGFADVGEALTHLIDPPRTRALAPHSAPKADLATDYDAAAQVAQAHGRRELHAWADGERYLYPHHDSEGKVVWQGVGAAMARFFLNPTLIPTEDRQGVYNHLQRHYEQFNKTAPELLEVATLEALSADDIRGLFLEGEEEFVKGEFRAGAALSRKNRSKIEDAIRALQDVLGSTAPEEPTNDDPPTGEDDEEEGLRTLLAMLDSKVTA